jgi:threonine dehydrogenase-like Zn-dependent dehydrogenase
MGRKADALRSAARLGSGRGARRTAEAPHPEQQGRPTTNEEGTVEAVVYEGPRQVQVRDVPDARIERPTDALVRITSTNICGSDLHMYEGRTDFETDRWFGHENMGQVVEVGEGVDKAFDFGEHWLRGQKMGTGHCPVKKYNRALRDLIAAGKATPSWIVSHDLPLDRAPEGYEHFDDRDEGWTRVVLHPDMAMA